MLASATEPAPAWLLAVIVVSFLIVFPSFWCLVVWILSHVGGWQRLARRYAAGDRPVSGQSSGWVQGMVGCVSYRSTLTFRFTADGFFVESMPLFRMGHPRLFIPWSEVKTRKPRQVFWWKMVRLSIGDPVIGTITLPARLLTEQAPD